MAPVEGCCRASASLLGIVGQVSSGKTLRARLKEKDSVNFERCLCGALGVGLEEFINYYTSDYPNPRSRMNPNRCLCGALGVGLEASHQSSFLYLDSLDRRTE
ncbi:hypothetical protein ACFX2F_013101 [Malus domestica]